MLKNRSLMPRLGRVILMMAAVLALGVVLIVGTRDTVPTAFALSITVDSLADTAHIADDAAGGGVAGDAIRNGTETIPTVCGIGGTPAAPTGDCTLRAAVYMGNANGDTADTITFEAGLTGTITLGTLTLPLGPCGTITAASCGTNGVVDNTTIDGPTASPDPVITVDCETATPLDAFTVTGASNTIRDLNIVDCDAAGIVITGEAADSNKVLGNYIGIDLSGTLCPGTTGNLDGVEIELGADNNQIGDGTSATDRNVISCNTSDGVEISGASTGNVVENNYIGTNDTGTVDRGNTDDGIDDTSSSSNNVVNNLISGNDTEGIDIGPTASGGSITGNTVGLAADGSTPLGNTFDGIEIDAGSVTVGGTTAADRNVVSGNGDNGIELRGAAAANTILGNYIGTDSSGNAPRANGGNGVAILGTANGNVVGGQRTDATTCTVGPCNVISGNLGDGVEITGSAGDLGANRVEGNNIGLGANGTTVLGNSGDGVADLSTSGNVVGGTAGTVEGTCLGVCNRIAGNAFDGVAVSGALTETVVRRNEHFGNTGLGIDLDVDGVSCEGDIATPPPHGVDHAATAPTANGGFDPCPVITNSSFSGGAYIISGNDGGDAGADVVGAKVDLYLVSEDPATAHGEGGPWVGEATVQSDGTWTATGICIQGPTKLTANITDVATGVSSEFGPNFDVVLSDDCIPTPTNTPTNTPVNTPTLTATPTITLTPTATATGTPPTATPTATATATATVTGTPPTATATDTATATATATNTTVPPTATNTPTPVKALGDVNQDGDVNSVDAALILQLEAGLITSLPGLDNGDVNEDGTVNAVDASLILQFEAGLIDTLPPSGGSGF